MTQGKPIRMLAFVKFQAVLMALVGLAAGVLYSFGGLVSDVVATGSLNPGTALAFLALLGMPCLFAAAGAALGLVEAVLYNLLSNRLGWLDVDFGR